MEDNDKRLIVVSNRLPVTLRRDVGGLTRIEPGSGGLISALEPILKRRHGLWLGWTGGDATVPYDALAGLAADKGYALVPVLLRATDVDLYYNGFANEVLWPLFHDFIWLCNFDPAYWPAYQSVNRGFALAVAGQLQAGDFVWVHDYHLMPLGAMLREQGVRQRLGFFLHIPFPSPDGYLKLPWRTELMEALLRYDLVGFQTLHDLQNFIRCVRSLIPETRVVGTGRIVQLRLPGRHVTAGAFPISIDFADFAHRARSNVVQTQSSQIRKQVGGGQIALGIDRLDYTKGIPRRLNAFAEALTLYPELRRRLTLVQVVIPSRHDVEKYRELKREIERLVGEINGRFTQPGWVPIHYLYRSLGPTELLAFYRAADMALVTPLKDGMNLIAKEYCASNVDHRGVLVLSEFAGAATQLFADVLLVNPFDKKAVAAAIHNGFNMDSHERSRRMQRLRQSIRRNDVYRWVDTFLNAATQPGNMHLQRKAALRPPTATAEHGSRVRDGSNLAAP